MDLIAKGIVAGVLGTVVMDALNHLFARLGIILKIEVGIIGRMAAGWLRGRFRYSHPDEMKPVANELLLGYIAHYAIGVGLSVPFVIAWGLLVGGSISPFWTFAYGVATTAASLFFVYPCMGLGIAGRIHPDGLKAPLSSLANHIFYGIGLAVAITVAG